MPTTIESKSTTPVIVYNGWGRIEVHPLSIETAREWLTEQLTDLPEGTVRGLALVQSLQKDPSGESGPYVLAASIVRKLFSSILTVALDGGSNRLYRASVADPVDPAAFLPVTKAVRDELILWAFENKCADPEKIRTDELNATHPEKHLSFMAGLLARTKGRELRYLSDDEQHDVGELSQLLYGKWKPDAQVSRVVSRYLEVLNKYGHREERYEQGEFHGELPTVAPLAEVAQ